MTYGLHLTPNTEFSVHGYEQRGPNNEKISTSPSCCHDANVMFPSSNPSQPNFSHTCFKRPKPMCLIEISKKVIVFPKIKKKLTKGY